MPASQETTNGRPAAVKVLLVVLGFLGLTALGGGLEMLSFPRGNEYILAEWLDHIPLIDSWIVPGLVLGLVFGLGSLVTLYGVYRRPRWRWLDGATRATGYHWSWLCSVLLGAALLAWILLEVVLIPDRSPVELLYIVLGLVLLLLPLRPSTRAYLGPAADV